MALRDYQQRTIDQLYSWFSNNSEGNPCIVMPTGSGKSHIIAELCRDAIQSWPDQKILILTHVKELIEQDAEKILQAWPDAPIGIYSAGLGVKQLGEPITIAGIQSIRKKAHEVGHVDLVMVDEAHLISHKREGGYRTLLSNLKEINPSMRVVGLTATPYRLGHGLISESPALFQDLIDPTSIEELVHKKYLAPLFSKATELKLSTEGVKKRGGDYVLSQLQQAVNTTLQNEDVVDEIIRLAGDRKAWLLFCAGVDHAFTLRDVLTSRGVSAECVTGDTPKKERAEIIEKFKAGKIKAVTNANVLTTGFNYPDIDLIAFCRPTMSPGLYVQMAGRGMRIKSHTDHCLALDFAGVVQTHGPITNVQPPGKDTQGDGEAPVKLCEQCNELVHAAKRECPACGFVFPPPQKPVFKLHNDDIMGTESEPMEIAEWEWRHHVSRAGKEMVKVSYYGTNLTDPVVTEYLCLLHGGYAAQKAINQLGSMARVTGVDINNPYDLSEIIEKMNQAPAPVSIKKKKDGKFFRVTARCWHEAS